MAAGVDPGRVILDPGLGFAKHAGHDWRLLAELRVLLAAGFPVLVGASRKRFIGAAMSGCADGGPGSVPRGRDAAPAAVSALAAAAGAACVRVHDVRSSLHAVRMAAAWVDGGRTLSSGVTRRTPGEKSASRVSPERASSANFR